MKKNEYHLDAFSQILAPIPNVPDELTAKYMENQIKRAEIQNDILEQDKNERKRYAFNIYSLICAWLVCIFIVISWQGFGTFGPNPFHLSDSVILALVGSTTINVLGLFVIVVNYLFKQNDKILQVPVEKEDNLFNKTIHELLRKKVN